MRRSLTLLVSLLALLALVATACGDDGDTQAGGDPSDDSAGSDDAADGGSDTADGGDTDNDDATGGDGSTDGAGDGPAAIGCPAQGFDGTISRVAAGDHAEASFSTADVWVDGVIAARLEEGARYTLYASDHEYVGDPRDFDTVVAAPGGTLATIFLQLADGLVAGQPIDVDDDGAWVPGIVDAGGGASSSSMNQTGSATPIAWSADWICAEYDYADDEQTIVGTISAPIVAGF